MALFAAGAVLALAGMLWRRDSLVVSAIAVLAIGIVLGWRERRKAQSGAGDDAPDGDGGA